MGDNRQMWAELGMDLEKHDDFLAPLPAVYQELFLNRPDRPAGMGYFDAVVGDVHGIRVRELVEHRRQGGKVVASFCVFVPDEITLACGGVSIGLCAGAQYPVPAAEKILPRALCPLIKSSLGFKLERICPYFQVADLVVGETTCDGKKKAWEILNEYIPVHVMELPQKKGEADFRLWRHEVEEYLRRMEEMSGKKVTAADLKEAAAVMNRKRRALKRLYRARQADPAPISGLDAMLIVQLSFFDDPVRFSEKVEELCEELEKRITNGKGVAPQGTPRILIAGTPMPLPHWKLHALIEKAGGVVVCEESCTGTRYFEQEVDASGETREEVLDGIARRAMGINCACFTPNEERVEDILRLVREYWADGVIYYNLQFCQPYSVEFYRVEKTLAKEGIPVLHLESDFSDEDTEQLRTRIEAFLELIRR